MAIFPLVERFHQRLKSNFATEAEKNVGEQLGKAAATYLAGTEFIIQINATLRRIFGPVAADWLGKIGGIGAAAGIGSPEPLVKLLMLVGNTRPQAERIAGEAIDEFLKTFAEGLSTGLDLADLDAKHAAEDAINLHLVPKFIAIKEALDKTAGIVHFGTVVSVHATDCKEVCIPPKLNAKGGKEIKGFNDINRNRDKPKDQKNEEQEKIPDPELIENAKVMMLKDMIAYGIDVEKQSTCKCRGLIKEYQHLVGLPRTFRECRVMLSKGSEADRQLESQFFNGIQRLRWANQTEVHPADLHGFERKLNQPVWTIDQVRLAIRDWNPDTHLVLDHLMKAAMIAFDFKESWPDRLLHEAKHVGIAWLKGHGSPTTDAIQARVQKFTDESKARTTPLEDRVNRKKRMLRQGK